MKGKFRICSKHHLKTLKVIGSVGEPINEEAWHWYNDNVSKKCPIVDTWWQQKRGIMISPLAFITPTNQPTPHYHCLNSTCFDERQGVEIERNHRKFVY
jgi:acetyl-CoA synthetase